VYLCVNNVLYVVYSHQQISTSISLIFRLISNTKHPTTGSNQRNTLRTGGIGSRLGWPGANWVTKGFRAHRILKRSDCTPVSTYLGHPSINPYEHSRQSVNVFSFPPALGPIFLPCAVDNRTLPSLVGPIFH
jgi:hypothetical protein